LQFPLNSGQCHCFDPSTGLVDVAFPAGRGSKSLLPRTYADQMDRRRRLVADYFPPGTRATVPAGGCLLWVELPDPCSAAKLFQDALGRFAQVQAGNG